MTYESQMFHDVISALHQNISYRGPERYIIPGYNGRICIFQSFTIKNDNGSEVCSKVARYGSLRSH